MRKSPRVADRSLELELQRAKEGSAEARREVEERLRQAIEVLKASRERLMKHIKILA